MTGTRSAGYAPGVFLFGCRGQKGLTAPAGEHRTRRPGPARTGLQRRDGPGRDPPVRTRKAGFRQFPAGFRKDYDRILERFILAQNGLL